MGPKNEQKQRIISKLKNLLKRLEKVARDTAEAV